jgi:hypothetical protein
MANARRPALRLPKKLAYTAMHCAIVGGIACSGHVDERADAAMEDAAGDDAGRELTQDASQDVRDVTQEAGADVLDCDGPKVNCQPQGADSADCNITVCDLSQCPSDCEAFG